MSFATSSDAYILYISLILSLEHQKSRRETRGLLLFVVFYCCLLLLFIIVVFIVNVVFVVVIVVKPHDRKSVSK